MKLFIRNIRILSSIVLFFFLWSFGPLFQIPTAIAADKKAPAKQTAGIASQGPVSSGERFEKALESIRENIERSEKKFDKGEDDKAEQEHIRSKRAEIDSIDAELRKEFSETEKKLKSAKLPKEILDRHAKFVKHYEDNLKELKSNMEAVERSAISGKQEKKNALAKAKLHLEKTKAPSRHQKLDPNNLPFRNRKEVKPIAPRLKKEQFEKDFPSKKNRGTRTAFSPQRSQRTAENRTQNGYLAQSPLSTQRTASLLDADQSGWTRILDSSLHRYISRFTSPVSRVQLAYNGPASDMPFELPRPSVGEGLGEGVVPLPNFVFSDANPESSFSASPSLRVAASGSLMLAQATVDLPTADDLAETPDVQFTPEIQAKAQEIGGNPVKIYEWVRNNIEYAPTYGSIQGADQCLQSKICNDMDTASLLIALLRTSGIAAKYQYATVEIPIEQAMNWVGGVTDPKMVGTIFATNGVPVTLMKNSSSVYKAVQLEHIFVQAFIDYIPSRGAVHRQGDTWISLDPSFKQYNYTQGIDIKSAVPFDAQTFADQLVATATTNTVEGYVTNVNSALVQQTM
ncbi:MAG: hypothetical protein OEW15_12905, partial [Nitrospirota bacterium]|nr:hypothetical protein [Nitrospirota bacterium]